jgi:Zn-dependent protease
VETEPRTGVQDRRAVSIGSALSAAPPARCPRCGSDLPSTLLACPSCQTLVHATDLKRLADQAKTAQAGGDLAGALAAWREALELLPRGTRQFQAVSTTIDALSREADESATMPGVRKPSSGSLAKGTAGIGALGLLLSKGKLLLLGLTKAGTLLSMLLSFGAYWTLWGWRFALGFVVSIYVHEMGHIAALNRLGIKATAPMFIPGFGAIIRLKQYPIAPRENARVGLAGPIWGLGAALAAYAVFLATGNHTWGAIAQVGGWINLFNLLPVWQLDGARGFHALSRAQRWIAVAILAAMWLVTKEGLLVLLALAAAFAAWRGDVPEEGDDRALVEYGALAIILSLLTRIPVRTV